MNALDADRGRDPDRLLIRGPLFGRGAELGRLLGALSDAEAGHGALILIEGEAGIGKSRLAEAVADEAAGRGDTVLWGSAWESGGAPAYWPWTQAVRDLLRERPAKELLEDLGTAAPLVAQVAPELTARLALAVDAAPNRASEAARFAAFDATATFLRAVAERRPLLIVFDDLHAVDADTARLLEFVARGLRGCRLLVIATTRSGEPAKEDELAEALKDLAKIAQMLPVSGLSRHAVGALARLHTPGEQPSPELVDYLFEHTDGNPLFVEELTRLLTREGGALPRGTRLPVPKLVREVIRRRLAPVPHDVIAALSTAAVIGPVFQLATLARVQDSERAETLAQLDVATAAGLVRELPGSSFRYRFKHALVRETLYDDLEPRTRAARHAAVGDALVETYGDAPELPLSEVAHHYLQAARAGDPGRAADFAARAGEHALDTMAYEHAAELFDSALQALELLPPSDQRGRILFAKGKAEVRAGRLDAGRASLASASVEARRLGDPTLLARAALASAPWGLATGTDEEERLLPLLREALDSLPTADSALRARLMARIAAAEYWSSPIERREARCLQAIAIARRLDDPATLAFVLSDAHRATWSPDSPTRALPWADEISALAERTGHVELALIAHSWRISLLLELGRITDFDLELATFKRAAARAHQRRAKAQALLHAAARAIIAGEFAEADKRMDDLTEHNALLSQDTLLSMRAGALWFVMREAQGRLPELGDVVRYFAGTQSAMPVWRCGLLCVLVQAGEEEELRTEYERFAVNGFGTVPRDNLWLASMALLTEACAHLGDAAGAAELEALLTPYAGRNAVTPDVALIGPVDRYLGLLAATRGDRAAATAWFASARRLARAMGARPTLARLALDEARLLRDHDPARSSALASEAAALAKAVGLERIEAAAAELARPPEPPAPMIAAVRQRRTARFCRRGESWEVRGGGEPFMLTSSKGLHYLACLLAAPTHQFHVLELASAIEGHARPRAGASPDPELAVRLGTGDGGPLLDPRAKADYQRRMADLRETIADAEEAHNSELASLALEELQRLEDEIMRAVGPGGRDRRFPDASERARQNVGRAIRAAIARVSAQDAALGHHLSTCVRTGLLCCYDPGPDPLTWDLGAASADDRTPAR